MRPKINLIVTSLQALGAVIKKKLPDSKSKIANGANAVMPHQNVLTLDVAVRNGRLTLLRIFQN